MPSAEVVESDAYGVKKVEKAIEITLNASGATATALNVTLDMTFLNTPKMLVVTPHGAEGTYTPTYDSSTPKISVAVTGEGPHFQSKVVPAILVAYDQP